MLLGCEARVDESKAAVAGCSDCVTRRAAVGAVGNGACVIGAGVVGVSKESGSTYSRNCWTTEKKAKWGPRGSRKIGINVKH